MFCLVIKMRIDPANAGPFEQLFAGYAKYILATDPGIRSFCLGKGRIEEGSYRVIEIYESEEASKLHSGTAEFQAFRPALFALLLEPPVSERLDIVA